LRFPYEILRAVVKDPYKFDINLIPPYVKGVISAFRDFVKDFYDKSVCPFSLMYKVVDSLHNVIEEDNPDKLLFYFGDFSYYLGVIREEYKMKNISAVFVDKMQYSCASFVVRKLFDVWRRNFLKK